MTTPVSSPPSTLPRIGLIGLGRMGTAMAQRLLEQGLALTVWNRTPGRAAGLGSAKIANSPAELAEDCDLILVIVRDAAALADVYQGSSGLAKAQLDGKTVVEMSTAPVAAITEALRAAQAAGARVIDAPVSGSVGPARRGELLVMAGGDAAVVDAARPAMALLARRVAHAGPLGSGITMKLVVNLPLACYWQSLGEALGIGVRNGLALDSMLAVVAESKAAIGALQGKISRILDASLPAEFDLAGLAKDLSAMAETADSLGHDTPVCRAALQSASSAVAAGWGERDLAQLVAYAAATDTVSPAPGAPRR